MPTDHVEGIMGHFDPATPIHIDEIRSRGIAFDYNRYCRPYIRWYSLIERFGDAADYVKETFMHDCGDGYFQLKEQVLNQRRIVDYLEEHPHDEFIGTGLVLPFSVVYLNDTLGSRMWEYLHNDSLSQNAEEFDKQALPDVPR